MGLLKSVGMDSDGHFTISQPGDTLSTEVQADWSQSDSAQNSYIKNKPTVPSGQVQSDWTAITGLGVVLNKPTIPAAQIQSDWNESNTGLLDYIKNKPTIPSVVRTTSTDTISLVGTGATGTQVDAAKDSTVRYNVSTSTTTTIGGPGTSLVSLKICATNNATEGSWTTVATLENDQTITLAVALNSLQTVKGQLCADVPAGWYRKLVNSGTGTHAETFVSGQKTIYG